MRIFILAVGATGLLLVRLLVCQGHQVAREAAIPPVLMSFSVNDQLASFR